MSDGDCNIVGAKVGETIGCYVSYGEGRRGDGVIDVPGVGAQVEDIFCCCVDGGGPVVAVGENLKADLWSNEKTMV